MLYLFIVLFAATSIMCIFLYYRNKKLVDDNKEMNSALNDELIKIKHRQGFYDGSYTLTNQNNDVYKYRVYVTELEKYKNGFSKLKLEKVDMISGFSTHQYNSIISFAAQDFLDIQSTSNITFLEKDEDLTEVRKDKLERILKDKTYL